MFSAGPLNESQRPPAASVQGLTYAVGDRRLLDSVDLQVLPGESVAVVGPSGSGKSTLLSCLLGLNLSAAAGSVRVAGVDLSTLRARALARHRQATTGMVFQFGELLPELSPLDNVALPALLARVRPNDAYRRARDLLTRLGVPEALSTDRLSGGERQRTAVARALINDPVLLLADEPTGALDETSRNTVADLLFQLPQERGCALVVVTHDLQIAARAERILRLHDGVLDEVSSTGGAR